MKTIRLLLAFFVIGLVAAPLPALAQKKKSVINLYCWSEYVPQTVIDGFTKKTGIKVNVENYDSNETMLAKVIVAKGKYDLIQPSEYAIEALGKAGELEALNMEAIPNFKNIDPKYLKLPHDPENKYSVPWMVGTVGIAINTAKVKEPVKGYKDVFSGKYKKRIVILNDARETVTWAMHVLGMPINDVSPEALEKVKPTLKEWLPQVKVYDSDSPKTALLNGDVDLGIVWSGEGAILCKRNKKFAYVLPEEGVHLFIDSLAIPKGAANKENAEKFINYILEPEVSVLISKDFPYTNPNVEARKKLTKAELENPASYPPNEGKLETFRDVGKAMKDIEKLVTDLKGK